MRKYTPFPGAEGSDVRGRSRGELADEPPAGGAEFLVAPQFVELRTRGVAIGRTLAGHVITPEAKVELLLSLKGAAQPQDGSPDYWMVAPGRRWRPDAVCLLEAGFIFSRRGITTSPPGTSDCELRCCPSNRRVGLSCRVDPR